MDKSIKEKYLSSAALLLIATVLVKVIGAVYKIPLTGYIGATGRGYFSIAYNLFMPIHAITMGAFPVALSSLVSKYLAKGDTAKVQALKKASNRLFFWIGVLGMGLMLVLAKPYAVLIADAPKAVFTILVLTPSALFSSMAAARRSFAEGHLNMAPTAICQILEALFKMIFGLLFARLSMSYLYEMYLDTGAIFGTQAADESEALSMIYPITSAFAMLGVTLGSFVAWVYVCAYSRTKYNGYLPKKQRVPGAAKELISFSLPLVAATVIQSLSAFLDTASVQYCLSLCGEAALSQVYEAPIALANVRSGDVVTYVYGLYSAALDFKNLIPSVTMALGVAAVPALSAAYESSNGRFAELYEGILKYTVILSAAGGGAMALYSYDLLKLFYNGSNPDIVLGCHRLLFWFGVTVTPVCLASTCVFAVQALGYSKRLIFPFILSGLIRVGLNFYLVSDTRFHLYGSVISTFVSYTIISLWGLWIIGSTTKARISFVRVFLKPGIAAALTCLAAKAISESFFAQLDWALNFMLSVFVFLTVLTILLLFFGTLSTKDLKFIGVK